MSEIENLPDEQMLLEEAKSALLKRELPAGTKPMTEYFHGVKYPVSNLLASFITKVNLHRKHYRNNQPNLESGLKMDELDIAVKDENLTEFGKKLIGAISGKLLIDLGSGDHERSPLVNPLSQKFGATGYVGVDKYLDMEKVKTTQLPGGDLFKSVWLRSDILNFLKQLEEEKNRTFFISGMDSMQPTEQIKNNRRTIIADEFTASYISATKEELKRVVAPRDKVILFGNSADTFALDRESFSLEEELIESYDKIDSCVCSIYSKNKKESD